MKNFIVPTDFSPQSVNAALYATNLANFSGAAITLFHVCQPPISASEIPVPDMIAEDIEIKAAKEMATLKAELLEKASAAVEIHSQIAEGDFLVGLTKIVKLTQPDAVIMGTHGKGNLDQLMFGSNTLSAAKNISCPLMVIPAGARFRPVKKIGFACDFRDVKNTIPAEMIKNFIQLFSAKLYVLHVSPEGEKTPAAEEIKQSQWVSEIFEDVHPEFLTIHDDHIESALSSYVLSHDIDLLLVVPKKHSFASSLLHKTHLKNFILNAQVPLVSIHA